MNQLVIPEGSIPKMEIIKDAFRGSNMRFEECLSLYKRWLRESVFIHCQKSDGSVTKFEASKRGNDIYRARILNKYNHIRKILSSRYSAINVGFTDIALVSLTYSRQYGLIQAWDMLGKDLNNFNTKVKRAFQGLVDYVCVVEAQSDGYPHAHYMFWLPFSTKFHNKWSFNKKKKKWVLTHRFDDFSIVKTLKSKWKRGFSDIQASQSPRDAFTYVFKYLVKGIHFNEKYENKSLVYLWILQKRSLRVSRSLSALYTKFRNDLITGIERNSAVLLGISFKSGAFISAGDLHTISFTKKALRKLKNEIFFRVKRLKSGNLLINDKLLEIKKYSPMKNSWGDYANPKSDWYNPDLIEFSTETLKTKKLL